MKSIITRPGSPPPVIFYINRSRLNQNHGSFAKFGAKLWNSICDKFRQLPKGAFKKHINDILFSLLEAEDDYVESPILLQKIHNNEEQIQSLIC